MAQQFLLTVASTATLDDGFIAAVLAEEVKRSVRNKLGGLEAPTVTVVSNDDADLTPLVATTVLVETDDASAPDAQLVTFTATVSGGPTTEGYVVFSSDVDGVIGVDTLTAGVATLATDALTVDDHVITATYTGTDDYASSVDTVAQTITA